jgi:mandelate racemase
MTRPSLRIRSIKAVGVEVPMNYVLGTSATAVRAAPLLLIDVETEEGVTGRAYLFCYVAAAAPAIAKMLEEVQRVVEGDAVVPQDLWAKLAKRFTLLGVQGIVRMAMAGFDVACWDALAIAANMPLASFLGASPRSIPAYNSNGLGLMPVERLQDEAEQLLDGGFRALKLRLGYPTLEADVAAVRAVRARVSDDVAIMVDYNQCLQLSEALRRGRALDGEGVYWLEEMIRHDDYAGSARLSREFATPIQLGENFALPVAMNQALTEKTCEFVMPDLERIGGVTGWRQAAALASVYQVPMSSHLFPEVSAHLLAATPTCHWLEYVDWMDAIVVEPTRVSNGQYPVSTRPGNGLVWDEAAVRRYKMNGF